MAIYELNDEDIASISALCDLALKTGGLQNLEKVTVLLGKVKAPIKGSQKGK